MSKPMNADQSSFAELVENAKELVLVDFWAPWCGPCRMIAPTLDVIAEAYQGRVRVVKVNVDESPELATRFGIRSIPTLGYFKNGTAIAFMIGAVSRAAIEEKLNELLG